MPKPRKEKTVTFRVYGPDKLRFNRIKEREKPKLSDPELFNRLLTAYDNLTLRQ